MAKLNKINISFSLRDIRNSKFDSKYLFLLVLLLVFVMDFFVIKVSWGIVSNLQNQSAPVAPINSSGRINFSDYNLIVQRINNAGLFVPTGGITKNPFSPKSSPPAPAVPPATTTPPAAVP